MKKLLLSLALFLLPSLAVAQVDSLEGAVINIDATNAVNICSGTGDIRIATGCTGGGTQYTWVFDASTGKLGVVEITGSGNRLTISSDESDIYSDIYIEAMDDIAIVFGDGDHSLNFIEATGVVGPSVAENVSLGSASAPFGSINIGDNVYLQMYQSGSLRSYLGYEPAGFGSVWDSDSSINLNPNNYNTVKFTNNQTDAGSQIQVQTGSEATAAYSYLDDNDTGMYNGGSGVNAFSSNASRVGQFDSGGLNVYGEIYNSGTVTSTGVLCVKSDSEFGQCTSAVGAGGTCTCS